MQYCKHLIVLCSTNDINWRPAATGSIRPPVEGVSPQLMLFVLHMSPFYIIFTTNCLERDQHVAVVSLKTKIFAVRCVQARPLPSRSARLSVTFMYSVTTNKHLQNYFYCWLAIPFQFFQYQTLWQDVGTEVNLCSGKSAVEVQLITADCA